VFLWLHWHERESLQMKGQDGNLYSDFHHMHSSVVIHMQEVEGQLKTVRDRLEWVKPAWATATMTSPATHPWYTIVTTTQLPDTLQSGWPRHHDWSFKVHYLETSFTCGTLVDDPDQSWVLQVAVPIGFISPSQHNQCPKSLSVTQHVQSPCKSPY